MSDHPRITWDHQASAAVVHLTGEFDMSDVDQLQDSCAAAIAHTGPCLVIDLSQTTFLDSSILGALVATAKAAEEQDGWLRFAGATHPSVHRVLEITKLGQFYGMYESVEKAVTA